jgi:hypothetical protein
MHPRSAGLQLSAVRIVNDPVALELQLQEAGADPEVVPVSWRMTVQSPCAS